MRRHVVTLVVLSTVACVPERARTDDVVRAPGAQLPALPDDPGALGVQLGVPAESLRAAGEERYGRQAYDSARAIWRVELSRARAARDSLAEARVLMWLGLSAWRLGDYAAARREGEASLALKRRTGLDAELSRSFNGLGLLAWNEGRHHDALAHFDSAEASARRHGDERGVARAIANLALVRVELGDFDGTRAALQQAIEAGARIPDELIQANALTNLAMLEVRLGNHERALELLRESRARYAKMGYVTGEANALGQQATAWLGIGDLHRAGASADSMLAIARARGLPQEVAAAMEILADVAVAAGNSRLALRRLAEADSIDAALGLTVERGINLRRTAGILQDLGETEMAIASATKALEVHRGADARTEMVYDLLQLASSRRAARELAVARGLADSAARLANEDVNTGAVREVAAVRARIALERGDVRRAHALLDELPATDLASDWPVTDLRAEVLTQMRRTDEARAAAERAVAQLERQRGSLPSASGAMRSIYLHQRSAPYARLVALHLQQRDTAAAFRVAASVPGRSLAERAAATEAEPARRRIAALEEQLEALGSDARERDQRGSVERALDSARASYERRAGAQSRGPELRGVQARLTPDEGVLLTLVGPDTLQLFAVRAARVVSQRVAVRAEALANQVRIARELLAAGRGGEAAGALTQLHEVLMPQAVAAALADARRLYVVPHGALAALPFAALRQRNGTFLVERQVVSLVPSLSAWREERGEEAPMRATGMAVFAPLVDSLPGTRVEAASIARLVPGAVLYVSRRSTERAVRRELRSGRAVHVASHGAHDAATPLYSRLVVGRGPGARAGGEDGRLEVHEILGLRTASPLVFLSGCETGLPEAGQSPFQEAFDESSLANAFLTAGARSVVATFWRVGDSTAAVMAQSFYREMAAGAEPDEALARAQREAITRGGAMTWASYALFTNERRKSGERFRITGNQPQSRSP